MTGRDEHKLKIERKIKTMLIGAPDYMTGFYNSIRVSRNTSSFRTHETYISVVLKFLKEVNKEPVDITLDDILGYFANNSDKSGSYLIIIYSALKRFFTYMTDTGRVKTNWMLKVEKPESTPDDQVKRYCLSTRETKKFVNNVKSGVGNKNARTKQEKWNKRDLALITLFLTTGMRCSALIDINVENINFEERTVWTIDKGNKRFVYSLSDRAMEVLLDWIEDREVKLKGTTQSALFISNRLNRISYTAVKTIVEKYAEKATDKKITPHKLRATYGTEVYRTSRDLYKTQQALGHSRPQTTEIYIRLKENVGKEAGQVTTNNFGI